MCDITKSMKDENLMDRYIGTDLVNQRKATLNACEGINITKLTQEKDVNIVVAIKEMEFIIKNLSIKKKKNQTQRASPVTSFKLVRNSNKFT